MEIPNYKGKIKNWIPWENRRLMMGENHYLMGWGNGKNYHPGIVKVLLFAEVSLINTQEECLPISKTKYINHEKLICTKMNRKKASSDITFTMVSTL